MGKIGLTLFILSWCSTYLMAQIPVPNLINYSKTEYNGGRQNWDIEINDAGVIYFSNTSGLLYNIYGEWGLLEIPENKIIRAALTESDTVWVGGAEIGYFVKKEGTYSYKKELDTSIAQIWNIEAVNECIFFQSEYDIFIYDKRNKTYTNKKLDARIWSILQWNEKIWVVLINGQIGTINKEGFIEVTQSRFLEDKEVRHLFIHRGKMFIVTFGGKLFSFNGAEVIEEFLPAEVEGNSLFTGSDYDQSSFLLGTINNGVFRISNDSKVLDHINSKNGLIDDTILAMEVDDLGNIWLGLDYGISKVELQSPFRAVFKGAATYHILDYNGRTYLATNKGLFRENEAGFYELVDNSGGQVWNIKVIDDELYICHIKGLYKLVGDTVEFVADFGGFIDVAKFGDSNMFIFSSYHGLFQVKKVGKDFEYVQNLELWGQPELVYDEKSLSVWGESPGEIVHEFRPTLGGEVEMIEHPELTRVFNTSIGTLFHDGEGILTFNKNEFSRVDHPLLSQISGKIEELGVSKDGSKIVYLKEGQLFAELILSDGTIHSYSNLFKLLGQDLIYENPFLDFDERKLRLATERGVLTFDFEFGTTFKNHSEPVIKSTSVLGGTDTRADFSYPYPEEGVIFKNFQRDLQFNFGINKSHYYLVEYRYQLHPQERKWSEWNTSDRVIFPQLKGGEYTLALQARINGGEELATSLAFSIQKYWYETQWILVPTIILLVVFMMVVAYVINRATQKKLSRQAQVHSILETKRTLQFKNEQLLQYVEIISHKNEFLNKLKSGLQKMRNTDAQRWVQLITNEVSVEKKEFLFHKLFSELHQDFIERVSKTYPSLTSNDIRLLTFYRVNLQKNEIASLMNISPRSLDTSRYRLRKKLHLDHDTDLDKFIRDF